MPDKTPFDEYIAKHGTPSPALVEAAKLLLEWTAERMAEKTKLASAS